MEANQLAWELYLVLQDQYLSLGVDKNKKEVRALNLLAVKAVLDIYEVDDKPLMLEKLLLIFRQLNN
jgi:hypothetical protein